MKASKRIAAAVLALMMVLAFAACGGKTEEETTTERNPFIFGDFTGNVGEGEGEGGVPASPQGADPDAPADTPDADTPAQSNTVRVTFPEGYTLARMIITLSDKGLGSEEEFWAVVNDSSVTSACSYIAQEPDRGARAFKMEGYLWPSTYEFYKDATPAEIFRKILATTQDRYASYASRASAAGMNLDEVITLASIVEKEAATASDMQNVASVLLNRLEDGMKLQCDSTKTYVMYVLQDYASVAGAGDWNQYRAPYNTYKCSGVPAGPICNPSSTAIEAVLNAPNTNYFYFVSKDGKCYFSETHEQHVAKCEELGVEPIED